VLITLEVVNVEVVVEEVKMIVVVVEVVVVVVVIRGRVEGVITGSSSQQLLEIPGCHLSL